MGLKITALIALWLAQAEPDAAEWMARGRAAIAARDTAKAAAAFGKACDLAPADGEACYFFGRTLQALDRFEEASRPLEQALKTSRETDASRIHRALALNFVGLVEPAKAEPHFLAAIRSYKGEGDDPRVDYGSFLTRQARAMEALPLLEQAAKAKPDSARAHAELGRAQLDADKLESAVRNLERAVRLDQSVTAVRLLLARAYQQVGRFADARRELEAARGATVR